MTVARSLPVLMPAVPGQKWSCHSCGDCCRTLVGHLSDAERARLDQQGWREKLGVEPYVRAGRGWVLNKHADGACVFLDENNRCRIHSTFGEKAKPLACRIFPFSLRPTQKGWQASLRFDCPSVIRSQGRSVAKHRDWLSGIAAELEKRGPFAGGPQRPQNRPFRRSDGEFLSRPSETVDLQRGVRATAGELEALSTRLIGWLSDGRRPLELRLIGAARLTAMLSAARLRKVRGGRFVELLDLLFGCLASECASRPEPPTPRQRAMLRQLAFAHAEHVDLALLRSNFVQRLRRRIRQLRAAKRFRVGAGVVPGLPGFPLQITFRSVESVEADGNAKSDAGREVENLLKRYVIARLAGGSVFGAGYYGWPVVSGLAGLWLSIAAAGWLARLSAAGRGAKQLQFGDVAKSVGVVDRSATRLPALGSLAERARVSFLLNNDGLARMLYAYPLSCGLHYQATDGGTGSGTPVPVGERTGR